MKSLSAAMTLFICLLCSTRASTKSSTAMTTTRDLNGNHSAERRRVDDDPLLRDPIGGGSDALISVDADIGGTRGAGEDGNAAANANNQRRIAAEIHRDLLDKDNGVDFALASNDGFGKAFNKLYLEGNSMYAEAGAESLAISLQPLQKNDLSPLSSGEEYGERRRRDVSAEDPSSSSTAPNVSLSPINSSGAPASAATAGDFVEYDYYENMTYEDLLHDIQQHIFPTVPEWISIFFHFIVFLIGLIGNALVCIAVYRNHTMRTVTNYFIVNLAVADFMVILFCLPFSVVWDVTETWFLGEIMCKGVVYIQTVSVTVSVLTLTFISIDRWYAICYPLKFKSTTGRAKTAIAIIWILALAFGTPELIVLSIITRIRAERLKERYLMQCGPTWSAESDLVWSVSKVILLYALPLTLMSIAYCQIVRVLWHTGNVPVTRNHSLDVCGNRRAHTFSMNTNSSTEGQLRSRRKAAKMLVAVVVMFAVCYFPVHLFSILRLVMYLPSRDIVSVAGQVAHWLCYANSAVNPVIYNFMSGKFRKEFRRAFERCWPEHRLYDTPTANFRMDRRNVTLNTFNTRPNGTCTIYRKNSTRI